MNKAISYITSLLLVALITIAILTGTVLMQWLGGMIVLGILTQAFLGRNHGV